VPESNIENARIRKLILYYYLVDDTINIIEEKFENNGIVSGPFLKRAKVISKDGNFINFNDLLIGKDLLIYGRYIKLTKCDKFTRDFYSIHSINQPNETEPLLDDFHKAKEKKPEKFKDNSMKDYLEHKLGGGSVISQKQFLEK